MMVAWASVCNLKDNLNLSALCQYSNVSVGTAKRFFTRDLTCFAQDCRIATFI